MAYKELSARYYGTFKYNPHKLLQAVLESDGSHVVNPTLLTPKNTAVYLCPKNDAEDRYEIRAICCSEQIGLALTLTVSKRIRSGTVCWDAPPEVEILTREDPGIKFGLAIWPAETEAYNAALEYWKWGKDPDSSNTISWERLCHYKREYLTDTFKYVGM